MSSNQCAACGQWSGKGHRCPPVTAPAALVVPVGGAVTVIEAPISIEDRVARAQAFLSTQDPMDEDPFAPYVPPAAEPAPPTPASGPISTGKDGTDVPPLSVEMPEGMEDEGRFYVEHPDLREGAFQRLDELIDDGHAFASITTVIGKLENGTVSDWQTRTTVEVAEADLWSLYNAPNEEERMARLERMLAVVDTNYWGDEITAFHRRLAGDKKKRILGYAKAQALIAAERGTQVHAIVEALSKGETPEILPEYEGYIRAYEGFLTEFPDMEYVYTEATVLNRDARTMGTTDAIVRINGKLYVFDYKTNKSGSVYSKTGMQLAAAANAEEIVHADGHREPMPEIAGGIGVGLSPKGKFQVFFFETDREGPNYTGFKAASAALYAMRKQVAKPKAVRRTFFDSL